MGLETGQPFISKFIEIPDGYYARDLVLIDGYQGQVEIEINTHTHARSVAAILMWNPVRFEWSQVHEMRGHEIGRMPLSVHKEEAVGALNGIASHLWSVANAVMVTSRERHEDLEVDRAEADEAARLEARFKESLLTAPGEDEELGDDAVALAAEGREATTQQTLEEWEQELLEAQAAPFTGTEPEDQG